MDYNTELQKYRPMAYRAARNYIRAYPHLWPLDVDDIAQIAMIHVWVTLEKTPDLIERFVIRQMWNRLTDLLKRAPQREFLGITEDYAAEVPTPDATPEVQSAQRELLRIAYVLPNRDGEMVNLLGEGLGKHEIAEVFGVTESAICHRRERIAEYLQSL